MGTYLCMWAVLFLHNKLQKDFLEIIKYIKLSSFLRMQLVVI
jgi:hypothetical protein